MALEHRDIVPQRRPEHAGDTTRERTRLQMFYALLKEAIDNFEEERASKPEKKESTLHSFEFFFKKSWDNFTEPLLEFNELMGDIEEKQWESKGAKSRAINRLHERADKAIAMARELDPQFADLLPKERREFLARVYEGFAAFIKDKEPKLKILAEDIHKGFDYYLKTLLGTSSSARDDRFR